MKLKKNEGNTFNRLEFFKNFLKASGTTYAEAGAILGMSQPNMSHKFDPEICDIRLSEIVKVIETKGYKINLAITDEADELESETIVDVNSLIVNSDKTFSVKPLMFLEVAMKRYGWTQKSLGEAMGLTPGTIAYWLTCQDLMLSRLFDAVKAMGLCLRMDISKEEDKTVNEGSEKDFFRVRMNTVTRYR